METIVTRLYINVVNLIFSLVQLPFVRENVFCSVVYLMKYSFLEMFLWDKRRVENVCVCDLSW